MKKLSQKRPFLFGLAVSLAVMGLLGAVSVILITVFPDLESTLGFAFTSATQLVLGIAVIFIARNICIAKGWLSAKGMGKGLLLGWLCILFAIGLFVLNVIGTPPEHWVAPRLWPLFVAVATALTTGLFEEILTRGLVLNVLLNKKGNTRKDILKACWISSALFGAMHLLNIIVGAGIIETMAQVIFATFAGMFFAAIYIRTKSLWAPIILHALFDLPSFIMYALLSNQAIEDMAQPPPSTLETLTSSLITVTLMVPFLIAALIMLRRKKIEMENELYPIPVEAVQ